MLSRISALCFSVVMGSVASAAVTTFHDRTDWQAAVSNPQTIDFSTTDEGAPISNPPADVLLNSLTIKNVTFLNVHSYYNQSLYTTGNTVLRVDLPANTTSFGADLSPFFDAPGTYTIRLSTGEVFSPMAGTIPYVWDFFGVTSTAPIQWIELSLDSSYLAMDNFSFVAVSPVQAIALDIVPGSRINPVRPEKGRVQVAILSTNEYDASSTDVRTIRFGANGTEARVDKKEYRDVNGDMVNDLVMEFRMRDTGIVCHDTTAKLTGETYQGQQIAGSDSIKTVGCK